MKIVGKLKRLVTVHFRISRRQAFVFFIVLAIFAFALFVRLRVTFTYELPLGRDGPYQLFNVQYLVSHWPSMRVPDPPLFFHFVAGLHRLFSAVGASLMTSFNIGTSLASALVAITTFFLTKRLTKNVLTALVAAIFSAFVSASFRMFGELQKNALGISLAPLSPLFFWKGIEGGKKIYLLISGVFFGLTMLSHELAAGTLGIAYLSYIAFLIGYRKRLPFAEIKAVVIMLIPAALVGGWYFYTRIGGAEAVAASGAAAAGGPSGQNYLAFYDEYIGPLLLVLATIGAGVAAYRRRAQDFFMLAWGMSALILAQPWVTQGYLWRTILQLATPAVILAAVGLVDGMGAIFKKLDKKLLKSQHSWSKSQKKIIRPFTIAFVCIFVWVVAYQVSSGYSYAWTGQQLQPSISMDEYKALQKFHEQVGDAYAVSGGRDLYWSDVVGLKGVIQGGEVWSQLSGLLGLRPGEQPNPEHAMRLAIRWYIVQENVGENIYVLVFRDDHQIEQMLENEQLFKRIFNDTYMRAYALSENFHPPQSPRSLGSSHTSSEQQPPPPQEKPSYFSMLASNPIRVLIFPIDLIDYTLSGLLSSVMKFAVGVPLTVMIWVLLPCLGWELVRRRVKSSEKLRKMLVVCVIVILVLVIMLVVRGGCVSDAARARSASGALPTMS